MADAAIHPRTIPSTVRVMSESLASGGAAADIAWEGPGNFFSRMWETVQASTLDPVGTFRTLRDERSSGKGFSLSLITAAIGNWPYLICAPCLAVWRSSPSRCSAR